MVASGEKCLLSCRTSCANTVACEWLLPRVPTTDSERSWELIVYLLLRDKGTHPLPHSHQHAHKNIILAVPLPCKKESWDCLPLCITHQLAYWQIHPLQSVFLLCNNVHSSRPLLLFCTSKQTIAFVDRKRIVAVKCLLLIIHRLYSYLMLK